MVVGQGLIVLWALAVTAALLVAARLLLRGHRRRWREREQAVETVHAATSALVAHLQVVSARVAELRGGPSQLPPHDLAARVEPVAAELPARIAAVGAAVRRAQEAYRPRTSEEATASSLLGPSGLLPDDYGREDADGLTGLVDHAEWAGQRVRLALSSPAALEDLPDRLGEHVAEIRTRAARAPEPARRRSVLRGDEGGGGTPWSA